MAAAPRLFGCLVLLSICALTADAQSPRAEEPAPDGTRWRAVFLSEAPLIVEFDLLVDLKSIDAQRSLAAESAVAMTDRDDDGRLSLDEVKAGGPIPAGPMAIDQLWAVCDADGDSLLTPDEFKTLLDRRVGPPVRLEEEESRSFSSLSLERLLDTNRDGLVGGDEWATGWKRLARVDFDDDDTLSAAELSTFAQTEATETTTLPALVPADDPKLPRLLGQLATRVRESGEPRGWAGRRWETIGDLSSADVVKEWAATADADLVARVRLSNTKSNYLLVEQGPARLKVGRVGRQRRRGRIEAQLARAKVEFRVANSGFLAADSKSFLLTQARIADEDQNGYLTEEEFGPIRVNVPVEFDVLDADGDEMLQFAEIEQHVDAIQRFAQLQVRVNVLNIAQNLFEKLDVDLDRRLSPRELARTTGSQSLDLSRMETAYRLTLETDAVNLLPAGEMSAMQRRLPVVRDRTDGPLWFQRMDRNRDGDISWREFLGPRDAFDRLDVDRDGLITVREATP